MKLLQTLGLILFLAGDASSQAFVPDTAISDQEMVQMLMGQGVFIDNIQINCDDVAVSAFTGNVPGPGFQEGIIISTGDVFLTQILTNDQGAGYCSASPGDPDISDLLNGRATYNGCAIEFDFISTCNNISIAYAFASEEYPENVSREFSDAFAIFISGPGYPEPANIALIPGTNTPVGIATVNQNTNNQYYHGSVANYMQYDGITKKFTATADVTECERYHMKIAIADAADCIFDSALLLEAGSFTCQAGNTVVTYASTEESLLIEGCSDGVIRFCNAGNLSEPYTLQLRLEGTATNGSDYSGIPASIQFTEENQCHEISISAIQDGIVEGFEEIKVIYTAVSGTCMKIDTLSLLITDFQPINPSFSSNDVCHGTPAYFLNTTSIPESTVYRFLWDFGNGQDSSEHQNPEYLYPEPGDYNVKLLVKTNLGCNDSVVMPLRVVGRPVADFNFSRGCINAPVEFFNTSVAAANSPAMEFYWNFGDGISSTSVNPSHFYSAANEYTVSLLSISSELGCADTLRKQLSIRGVPQASFEHDNFCLGASFSPRNLSVGDISAFRWDFGTGSEFSDAESPVFLYHQPGNYSVKLIATNEDNCSDTATRQVLVYNQPLADFTLPFVCEGQDALFTNTSTINSPETISSSLWQFGDNSDQLFSFHAVHRYANPGPTEVTLRVSTGQGCADSVSKILIIHPSPRPDITISQTEGCTPLCVELTENSDISAGTIVSRSWLLSDLTESDHAVWEHCFVNGSAEIQQQFDVSLRVTSDLGCENTISLKKLVNVSPSPVSEFGYYPKELYPHTRIEFSNFSRGDSTVTWNFGDAISELNITGSSKPVVYFEEEGFYTISIISENEFACLDTFQSEIRVLPFIQILIPSAFSPDNDGINDEFKPVFTGHSFARLEIFGRNGEQIFSETSASPSWNGTSSGIKAHGGVYFYRLYVTDHQGDHHYREGSILLLGN